MESFELPCEVGRLLISQAVGSDLNRMPEGDQLDGFLQSKLIEPTLRAHTGETWQETLQLPQRNPALLGQARRAVIRGLS